MAYFERTDERDMLILCNICNVKCAERSLTNHKAKCIERNPDKFTKGLLKRCKYDSSHIVEADKLDLHLEFCTKRQNEIVAEFQEESKIAIGSIDNTPPNNGHSNPSSLVSDDWNRAANNEPFIHNLSKLRI